MLSFHLPFKSLNSVNFFRSLLLFKNYSIDFLFRFSREKQREINLSTSFHFISYSVTFAVLFLITSLTISSILPSLASFSIIFYFLLSLFLFQSFVLIFCQLLFFVVFFLRCLLLSFSILIEYLLLYLSHLTQFN